MGTLHITFLDGTLKSFNCKSEEKAEIIVSKRIKVKDWKFYDENTRIPTLKKKKKEYKQPTQEDLEKLMKIQGLI